MTTFINAFEFDFSTSSHAETIRFMLYKFISPVSFMSSVTLELLFQVGLRQI